MSPNPLFIDCDFPGGNIIVDSIEGDAVSVHQDLRDTTQDWFYWCFRMRGAAGRNLTVRFTGSDVLAARGPAVSQDGGNTWRWLGDDCVEGQSFSVRIPEGAQEARFCMTIPYLEADLHAFLGRHAGHPALRTGELCRSRKGRKVELLQLGAQPSNAAVRVLIACRHHCCESLASYALEGLVDFVLGKTEAGRWLCENAAFLIAPFLDKDGVEDGDQGKLRTPHDHNRDYYGDSIYPETAALRKLAPSWSGEKLDAALDLHCPWIRGGRNETIFLVGEKDPRLWASALRFGSILERGCTGPLPFHCADALPFGEEWNTGCEEGQKTFTEWCAEIFPEIHLCNTLEIAYADAHGVEVNPTSARQFGADLGRALAEFLSVP
jgi:hypothetical protein